MNQGSVESVRREERPCAPPHSLPILVRGQTYTAHVSPASLDFQARIGHPAVGHPGSAAPCVVLLTRTGDRESDQISLQLAARGVPVLRFDSDADPDQGLCWEPSRGVLRSRTQLFRPTVSWRRCFSENSIPGGSSELDAYVREQRLGFAQALSCLDPGRIVNRGSSPVQPDRVSQLMAAQAAGIRVPESVVTNQPTEAAARIAGDGDLVIKSLGDHFLELRPGHLSGLFPRRLSREELSRETTCEPAPVLVQEFVPSLRELRIFAIGGRLLAFAVEGTAAGGIWTDPGKVKVACTVIPGELERPLLSLIQRWNLDVAAFDVLETSDGPVFLEVNPVCGWLFFESRAHSQLVSAAVADFLVGVWQDRLQ